MGRSRRQAVRHGYVVIDKPAQWTSHDVVARVRRIVGERRVGHAGTLDPAAVGVLPLAVGLATRTVEYLSNATKAYRAWIRFGMTTDSADGDGEVTSRSDPSGLTLATIEEVLEPFRGEISQRPPMHSAIQVDGKRLYELARKGMEIDVQPREITIHDLQVVDWTSPDLCIDVECSKGTYIRALARDIGEAAGTGAYLSQLTRTRSGPFTLADALSLDDFERSLRERGWESVSFPPDHVLRDLDPLILRPDQVTDWGHGKPVGIDSVVGITATVRAYDAHGNWLGIGETDSQAMTVRPVKVIPVE